MSTEAVLQSGVEAVKAGQFAEAVAVLEPLCQASLAPPAAAYYQAKMWLVRAYRGNNQLPEAIKLCRQLATSSQPQVQQWAQKTLPKLRRPTSSSGERSPTVPQTPAPPVEENQAVPPAETLDPATADDLLRTGIQALRRKQYDSAIAPLSQFVQSADPSHPQVGYAQTSLIKAYRETEQIEAAIALCKTVLDSPNEGAKAWAKQFLSKHDIQPEPQPASEPAQPTLPSQSQTFPTTHPTRVKQSPTAVSPQKDFGVPILSVTCYATYYFGLIYAVLFPASIYAGSSASGMDLLSSTGAVAYLLMSLFGPLIVSSAVLGMSNSRVAKANAKEAINLWITQVVIGIGSVFAILAIAVLMPWLGLLGLLLLIPLALVFYVVPLVAIIYCCVKPFEPFKIPFIWHILK